MAHKKYGEETVIVTKRVPESKVKDFNKMSNEWLLKISEKYEISETGIKESTKSVTFLPIGTNIQNMCSCVMEGKLFKRSKGCKKAIDQHKF